MPNPRIASLACLLLLLLSWPAHAKVDEDPVVVRARDVAALLVAEPSWAKDLFDPGFLVAVPAPRLKALCVELAANLGPITSVQRLSGDSPFNGRFELVFEREQAVAMDLTVGSAAPHAVMGLWFGPPTPLLADWEALSQAFSALPGQVSFAAAELGGDEPIWLAEYEPQLPLAMGSAFKLTVLGELAARVAAGDAAWEQVIPLREQYRSLPSGQLQQWPDGAPVTLHTLASLMISISDNTATDHLLFQLGRQAVEARMGALGNRHAALNRPFLSTGELFRLKLEAGGLTAATYLRFPDEAGRRAWLDEAVAELSLSGEDVDLGAFSSPRAIDTLEWFGSGSDLVRTWDGLRQLAAHDEHLLGVVSINPGLPAASDHFDLVGFKGGSEPGVLCLSFLLRKDERWFALAGLWNNTEQALEETTFSGLISRAVVLLAAEAD